MARRRRKLWYAVTVSGYWWCPPHGWVRSGELPKTHNGASNTRNLRTFKSARQAVMSAPKPINDYGPGATPTVELEQWLWKKGKRYLRVWTRIEEAA